MDGRAVRVGLFEPFPHPHQHFLRGSDLSLVQVGSDDLVLEDSQSSEQLLLVRTLLLV